MLQTFLFAALQVLMRLAHNTLSIRLGIQVKLLERLWILGMHAHPLIRLSADCCLGGEESPLL